MPSPSIAWPRHLGINVARMLGAWCCSVRGPSSVLRAWSQQVLSHLGSKDQERTQNEEPGTKDCTTRAADQL